MLAGIGSVVAGTVLPPAPAGAVAGIQGTSPPISGGHSVVPSSDEVGPLAPAAPPHSTASAHGGASLDVRSRPVADPRPLPLSQLTGYQWPLPHGRLTLPFGPTAWGSRVVDGQPFHDGLDMATFCGDRIVAAHAGVVLAASRHYDRKMGWIGDLEPYLDRLDAKSLWTTLPIVVVIDDGNGYRSIYAHLSKAVVKAGQTVGAGEFLGYEGKTGRASGCHLHYGLYSPQETARFGIDPAVIERMKLPGWEIARVDPLLVLPARAGTRLKPSVTASPPGVAAGHPPVE